VDGGQKAGRRSYGKERTARTHPHMRLGRGSQRTREGEGPHVRAGTSNTGGRGAGDRPDSELFASHFAIRRGTMAYGVDDRRGCRSATGPSWSAGFFRRRCRPVW
jgi:hypothetical protein